MGKEKVVAVDIGGTETIVAVVDFNFEIHDIARFETSRNISELVEEITEQIEKFDPKKMLPVGIAICGLLSHDGKYLLIAPNMQWANFSLRKVFGGLSRNFIVVNDGTAAGWASYITEKPSVVKRLLSITMGTGVGGGVVIDDSLLIGAGELGHVRVNQDGPLCSCGKKGCLETYAGGKNIPKRAKEWFNLDVKTPKELFDLAEAGNKDAIACWKKIGNIMGYTLSGVVNLNGIDFITIGGKVSRAKNYFLNELEKTLNDNLMMPEFQDCRVGISKWKHNFSLIGAASVVIKPPKNLQK